MDRIEAMKRFVVVAHTGSFTQASDQLNVPKSAISTSVTKLEKYLSIRLLHRSTRHVTLTEIGEQYLSKCQHFLQELDEFESYCQQQSDELTGIICIDMPGSFYTNVVLPRIHEWFQQYPKTEVKLLGADYRINPIKERVDFLVRVGELEENNLIAKKLGKMEIINCVSRGYAEHFGLPETIEDLKDHQLIGYSTETSNQSADFEYNTDGGIRYVAMPHLVTVSTTHAYMASCLAGLGIVQIPKVGVQTYLNAGELIEVLPDYRCLPMPVSILYESRQYMPHKVSIFMDWLTSIFNQFNESTPL
jgi:LysR family transcriptional regulator, regulator for bpeEF and oprC